MMCCFLFIIIVIYLFSAFFVLDLFECVSFCSRGIGMIIVRCTVGHAKIDGSVRRKGTHQASVLFDLLVRSIT